MKRTMKRYGHEKIQTRPRKVTDTRSDRVRKGPWKGASRPSLRGGVHTHTHTHTHTHGALAARRDSRLRGRHLAASSSLPPSLSLSLPPSLSHSLSPSLTSLPPLSPSLPPPSPLPPPSYVCIAVSWGTAHPHNAYSLYSFRRQFLPLGDALSCVVGGCAPAVSVLCVRVRTRVCIYI